MRRTRDLGDGPTTMEDQATIGALKGDKGFILSHSRRHIVGLFLGIAADGPTIRVWEAILTLVSRLITRKPSQYRWKKRNKAHRMQPT